MRTRKLQRSPRERSRPDRGRPGAWLLLLPVAAVAALAWWRWARGGPTGAMYRRVLRRTPLNDAERRAVERGGDAPGTAASLVADIALADRYDRYAG